MEIPKNSCKNIKTPLKKQPKKPATTTTEIRGKPALNRQVLTELHLRGH